MKGKEDMRLGDLLMDVLLPMLIIILIIISMILLLMMIIDLIKSFTRCLSVKQEWKISYGVIIDKSIEKNIKVKNRLIGNSIIPTATTSKKHVLWIEFEEEKFKITNFSFDEDVEIGDKVIIRYLESNDGIDEIELIEVIE